MVGEFWGLETVSQAQIVGPGPFFLGGDSQGFGA